MITPSRKSVALLGGRALGLAGSSVRPSFTPTAVQRKKTITPAEETAHPSNKLLASSVVPDNGSSLSAADSQNSKPGAIAVPNGSKNEDSMKRIPVNGPVKAVSIKSGSSFKGGTPLQSALTRLEQADLKKKTQQSAASGQSKNEEDLKMKDFCSNYRVDRHLRKKLRPGSKTKHTKGKKRSHSHMVRPEGIRDPYKQKQAEGIAEVEIVDGRIVVRESSLVLNNREVDESLFEEVYEDSQAVASYHAYTTYERVERWGVEETKRFYKALQMCGTDFGMMTHFFPGRSRATLRRKFNFEDRAHGELVERALHSSAPLDLQPFEISLGPKFDNIKTPREDKEKALVKDEALDQIESLKNSEECQESIEEKVKQLVSTVEYRIIESNLEAEREGLVLL